MLAMLSDGHGAPLRPEERPPPEPGEGRLALAVRACGVCRTDLHVVDSEIARRDGPVVPGHQVVGTVTAVGPGVEAHAVGDRVGVPWLGWTCGDCPFCRSGRENLCERALFTGADLDGGYAEAMVAWAGWCLRLPEGLGDVAAAPLLCGGLIGHRALRLCGDAERIGLYGFGASAHLVCQVARWQGRRLFGFVRAGDEEAAAFARSLGCEWAGDAMGPPPEPLDAAIIFAPAGELVPAALRAVDRGGVVVCAGIHMSDIPSFPYRDLWGERTIRSVANLTREDGRDFLALAPRAGVHAHATTYALRDANAALDDLRSGRLVGAAVLVP